MKKDKALPYIKALNMDLKAIGKNNVKKTLLAIVELNDDPKAETSKDMLHRICDGLEIEYKSKDKNDELKKKIKSALKARKSMLDSE